MNSPIVIYFIRFVLLMLVQVLILKNVDIYPPLVHLYLYPLFILLLPFRTPSWALIVTAFFLGLCVDMFYNTVGLHSGALVLTAYLRKFVTQGMEPRGGYEVNQSPVKRHMGINWYIQYTGILMAIHLTALFLLEELSFAHFGVLVLKIILSFIFSMILIIIHQYLVNPKA